MTRLSQESSPRIAVYKTVGELLITLDQKTPFLSQPSAQKAEPPFTHILQMK